jgi:hypothetical protein
MFSEALDLVLDGVSSCIISLDIEPKKDSAMHECTISIEWVLRRGNG